MQIKHLFKKSLNLIIPLVIIVVLTLITKVFLFASFKIPTPSMDPCIIPGDYVLVNKPLKYRQYGAIAIKACHHWKCRVITREKGRRASTLESYYHPLPGLPTVKERWEAERYRLI